MFPAVATLDACAPVAARLAAKHSTYEETEMTEPLGLLGLGS